VREVGGKGDPLSLFPSLSLESFPVFSVSIYYILYIVVAGRKAGISPSRIWDRCDCHGSHIRISSPDRR